MASQAEHRISTTNASTTGGLDRIRLSSFRLEDPIDIVDVIPPHN